MVLGFGLIRGKDPNNMDISDSLIYSLAMPLDIRVSSNSEDSRPPRGLASSPPRTRNALHSTPLCGRLG